MDAEANASASAHVTPLVPADEALLPYTSAMAASLQRYLLHITPHIVRRLPVPPELLLLLLPFMLGAARVLWAHGRRYAATWLAAATARKRVVTRDITAVTSESYPGDNLPSDRNAVLQNAIFMYLCKVAWVAHPVPRRVWRTMTSVLLLIDPFRFRDEENWRSPFFIDKNARHGTTAAGDNNDDNDSSDAEQVDDARMDAAVESLARSSHYLGQLLLVKLPCKGRWVPTNVDGIELAYSHRRRRVRGTLLRERTLHLRAYGNDAAARLERFALQSLTYFIRQLPTQLRGATPRYYLELQPPPGYYYLGSAAYRAGHAHAGRPRNAKGGVDDDDSGGTAQLSVTAAAVAATDTDNNNMASNDGAAASDDHDNNNSGGGGKPSQQLRFRRYDLSDERNFDTLFFADKASVLRLVDDFVLRRGRFAVEGFPYKLGLLLYGPPRCGKTSFVKALATYTRRHIVAVPLHLLETNEQLYDIFLNPYYRCVGESEALHLPMKDVLFLLEDTDATSPLVRARARERVVRVRAPTVLTAAPPATAPAWREKLVVFDDAPTRSSAAAAAVRSEATPAVTTTTTTTHHSFRPLYNAPDRLDLSGLLNVLDGVVDTPGRIVVFTTTHPERLDPALVRPGRMSTRLRMDYVSLDDVVAMAGLHFGDVPAPCVDAQPLLASLAQSLTHAATAQQTAADATGNGDADAVRDNGRGERETRPRQPAVLPLCMAAARVTHRSLSATQLARVRACVAAVEAEADAAAAAATTTTMRRRARRRYNIHVTPAEIEVLCTHSDSLDEFVRRLERVLRREGDAAELCS